MLTLTNRIDMRPGAVPLVIHRGQYDSDFSLVFELYSSAGNFTVESGTTAMIRGTKTDGHAYDADATIDISAKTVTVAGSEQMTAAKGRNVYELVLTKSGKVLSTANFILDVERAAMDADTIASESVLKELNAIIAGAETATEAAQTATAAAESVSGSTAQIATNTANIATNTADISDLKADINDMFTKSGEIIKRKGITPDKISYIKSSTNIIPTVDVDTTNPGAYYDNGNGRKYTNASWAATDYFRIEPNTTYYLKRRSNGSIPNCKVCIYACDKTFIEGYVKGSVNASFTTPANAFWCILSSDRNNDPAIGFDCYNVYLGTELSTTYYEPSGEYIIPSNDEISEVHGNLAKYDTRYTGYQCNKSYQEGIIQTDESMLVEVDTHSSSGFCEIPEGTTKLYWGYRPVGSSGFDGSITYSDSVQKIISFYDERKKCLVTETKALSDGIIVPPFAKYFRYFVNNVYWGLYVMFADSKPLWFDKNLSNEDIQESIYYVGEQEINSALFTRQWYKKVWGAYGDSVTEICNGNSLYKGWARYINEGFGFSGFYGRGVGGQRFRWAGHGGAVGFVYPDGQLQDRVNDKNKDNYTGEIPEGTVAIRTCFCSWDRITHMFPESIKDSIDMVLIMGGTNDLLNTTEDPQWVANDTTDPEWAASDYYSTYNGDFNIETMTGGMCSCIMKFQAWMPDALIVYCTPISGEGTTGQLDFDLNIDYHTKAMKLKETASIMSIPCIDVYSQSGINGFNRTKYIKDSVHPYLADGKMMLGRTIAGGLCAVVPMQPLKTVT